VLLARIIATPITKTARINPKPRPKALSMDFNPILLAPSLSALEIIVPHNQNQNQNGEEAEANLH